MTDGDRDLQRLYDEALKRMDFDREAAKRIVALRVQSRRTEDAPIAQQLDDETFLDLAVGSLHRLMQVDPVAGRRYVRMLVADLWRRGDRPTPSAEEDQTDPATRWKPPAPPSPAP